MARLRSISGVAERCWSRRKSRGSAALRLLWWGVWGLSHGEGNNECELRAFVSMLGESPTPSEAAVAVAASCRRRLGATANVKVQAECGAAADAPVCHIVDLMACVDGSVASCADYSGLVGQCREVAEQIEATATQCGQTPEDELPPVCDCACWGGAAGAPAPTPAAVIGWWPLDTSWCDASSNGHDLVLADGTAAGHGGWGNAPSPASSGGIGPAEAAVDMGAIAPGITTVASGTGLTVEGWTFGVHGGVGGVLFGFGDGAWGVPSLVLSNAWGFLWLAAGSSADSLKIKYPRLLFDDCWHHVALVLEVGWEAGGVPVAVYVDGVDVSSQGEANRVPAEAADGTLAVHSSTQVFGTPFRIGSPGASPGLPALDEVVLWSRALSDVEVAGRAQFRAHPVSGGAPACAAPPPPPPPPPPTERCTIGQAETTPTMTTSVRFLSASLLVVISDPTDFFHDQIHSRCGESLLATEEQYGGTTDWHLNYEYMYAAMEIVDELRPPILAALSRSDGISIHGPDGDPVTPVATHLWPQVSREMRVRAADGSDFWHHVQTAEVQFFTYIELDHDLPDNVVYTAVDAFGNSQEFSYFTETSISFALKVDQAGYASDGPKFGYLGSWVGVGGPMNVSSWIDQPFRVVAEEDDSEAYVGTVHFRANDTEYDGAPLTGETVLELNFSAVSQPGQYHLHIEGIGRSWSFGVGQNALGQAFFTHARGLFHQRCGMELLPEITGWPREDTHETFQGGHPPEDDDYKDHSADGWGFLDTDGAFPENLGSWFNQVAAQGTETPLPHVKGGWHDAADFDRRDSHFGAVSDLIHTFLMFPENFADGQLQIAESGNGIPDIIDEARWGVEVWRQAQEDDGRVGTWLEADSHPHVEDPGADHQPYYLSLATRQSTLNYAMHAALLARALLVAGGDAATELATVYTDSARRAYAFGIRQDIRITTTIAGTTTRWVEPEHPASERILYASAQLWLLTQDQEYLDVLQTDAMDEALRLEVGGKAHWQRRQKIDFASFVLAADDLPSGWGELCRAKIVEQAEQWLARQDADPYRKVWHQPSEGYFALGAWGSNGFNHIRWLTTAYGITGEQRFRDGALLGASWMHGTNPQGRPYTTGIGATPLTSLLHLPSRQHDEPVPGITIYGNVGAVAHAAATRVYGLFQPTRPDYDGMALSQLPPPFDNDAISTEGEVKEILQATVPYWRRLHLLQSQNVPVTEFTMWETVSNAVAVMGALVGPGWMPAPDQLIAQPRSKSELLDGWYVHP